MSGLLGRAGLVLLLVATASAAAARTLHWEELAVRARLDADGRLHVTERQRIVFDGAWNGGERVFRLPAGQRLAFHTLRRLDADGSGAVDLERGDLDLVDRYDWVGRGRLRWRSRLPADPPFDDTVLVYELGYTLTGVVWRMGDAYRLSHDFAFADRAGPIESFTLELELDPAWVVTAGPPELRTLESGSGGGRYAYRRDGLAPGLGVPLRLEARHLGATPPQAVQQPVPRAVRAALIAATLAALALLVRRFLHFERRQGRYERVAAPLAMDEGWLSENLLYLLPEEAGALWDQSIGRGEVAAVIARLVAEGKLASSVRPGRGRDQVLELELLVERDRFEGYERQLIDKLFFDGRERTDTEAVREHYKTEGFSPASTISHGVRSRMREVEGFGRRLTAPDWKPAALLFAAALACLVVERVTRGSLAVVPVIALLLVTGVVPAVAAWVFAFVYRKSAVRLRGPAAGFAVPLALLAAATLTSVAVVGDLVSLDPGSTQGFFALLGMAIVPLAVTRGVLETARTRDSSAAVRKRKLLASIRDHFRRELRTLSPALRDEWLPYLLAFGLERDVDRWFTSYRGTGAASEGAWTGGGAAFGTPGASRSWSAAAGSLAAGVSPPSSSGSSGGGGSFSGGGGGGGW